MNYEANEISMPKLSLAQVEKLLGDKVSNMVLYTFYDNIKGLPQGWNRTEYNGMPLSDLDEATKHANKLHTKIQSYPEFANRNLVLLATKTVSRRDFGEMGNFSPNPRYTGLGYIMSNFIEYNPQTGKFQANAAGWYSTGAYSLATHAAQRGVVNSMFYLANTAWALKGMIAAYNQKNR